MCDTGESCSVWTRTVRRARKQHQCDECFLKIPPGSDYVHVGAVFDGSGFTIKAHAECEELALDAADLACGERYWVAGQLHEHLQEAGIRWRDNELRPDWISEKNIPRAKALLERYLAVREKYGLAVVA